MDTKTRTPVRVGISTGQSRQCADCREPIAWVRTKLGKKIMMDFWSTPDGDFIITGSIERLAVVSKIPFDADLKRIAGMPRFTCHFETCSKSRYSAS